MFLYFVGFYEKKKDKWKCERGNNEREKEIDREIEREVSEDSSDSKENGGKATVTKREERLIYKFKKKERKNKRRQGDTEMKTEIYWGKKKRQEQKKTSQKEIKNEIQKQKVERYR